MDLKKQSKYEDELLKFISKNKIMSWSHIIWGSLSFSKRTAYNFELHNLQTIKDAFEINRSAGMNYLLQKWIVSDNATLQIAAMRIIADTETHQKLNQSYVDHTSKGDKLGTINITFQKDNE
jgi:hypothetical protein